MIRLRVALAAALAAGALGAATAGAATNNIFTVAGTGSSGFTGDGGSATAAQISFASGIVATADGGFLIADTGNHRVRRVSPTGTITAVAGNGSSGHTGDGGPATAAQLDADGVAATADGGFLIADSGAGVIRRVSPGGTITTVAGTGVDGDSGEGGPATAAQLRGPQGVATTADGGFLIADTENNRVKRVSPNGTITTVAGTGASGFSGDGGPATAAQMNAPNGIAVAGDGGILIADSGNDRVRRVGPAGTIATVAGTGASGAAGDGGPAVAGQLNDPAGVAATGDGGFLVADSGNRRIRRVSPGGKITTVAGNGTAGSAGDGAPATAAQLGGPRGVATTAEGGFLVADAGSSRIRFVDADLRPGPQGPAGAPGQAGGPGPSGIDGRPGVDGRPGADRDKLAIAIAGSPVKARRKRLVTIQFAATMAASVRFDVLKGKRRVGRRTLTAHKGRNTGRLRFKLSPGRYVLSARATAGNQVATDRVALVIGR